MQAHQQRVIDEKTELDERRTKLREFIRSNPVFKSLPTAEQERLHLQNLIMGEYSRILGERIEAFQS